MSATAARAPAPGITAVPKADFDWKPLALLGAVLLLAWPLVGAGSTWVTLSVAGLAMGLIIFIIASGLTLIFGLMDVLNFGHGVFIALGAYVATSVMGGMADWSTADSVWRNLAAVGSAMLVAMVAAGVLGVLFERVVVRPVYGQHLKQILITMGGMIVGEELIKMIWGPLQIALPLPEALRGAWLIGDAAIERYRVLAGAIGLVVFAALAFTLARTKIGLLIRAGVQDREMVEALGGYTLYRIRSQPLPCHCLEAARSPQDAAPCRTPRLPFPPHPRRHPPTTPRVAPG